MNTTNQLESSSFKEGTKFKVNETNFYLSYYAKFKSFQYRNIIRNTYYKVIFNDIGPNGKI